MTKVHVHVYELKGKGEFDCVVDSSDGDVLALAMREGLDRAKEGKLEFGEPDNRFLAMAFPEDE